MNCPQIQKLLHAHHDGELDVANTLLVDEHLADCPHCFSSLRQLSALSGALKSDALRFSAPAALRQTLRATITQSVAAEQEAKPARPWSVNWGWVAAAVMLVASGLFFQIRSGREDDRLVAELTSSHIRSLMASHLTDVASTDQHTVKPWFDGRIDFAPPVRDLKESGFPLVGGRLDVIDGRPVAALIFGRQKHLLNLFIWPTKTAEPKKLQAAQQNGYNVLRWSDGRMDFSVVSDLNENDLRLFVSDWSGQ